MDAGIQQSNENDLFFSSILIFLQYKLHITIPKTTLRYYLDDTMGSKRLWLPP